MLKKVGIEFETEFIKRNVYLPSGFEKTHDASIETPVIKSPICNFYEESSDSDYILGVEIVSTPLNIFNYDEIRSKLDKLIAILISEGEKEKSYRSGIHIHIDATYFDLRFLKNALILGLASEPIFFYVGSFGYINRAVKNDFTYCRSLHNPPIVSFGDKYIPVCEPLEMLKVKTISGFFKYMGVDVKDPMRYHPARYFWLNLYSTILHGTLEFRVFNKTFNTDFIMSAIELCKKFVEACVREDEIQIELNSIYNHNKFLTLNLYRRLNERYLFIDEPYNSVLEKLITISPQIKVLKEPVKTHLRRYELTYPQSYKPKEIYVEPKNPTFVDIHNLRGE